MLLSEPWPSELMVSGVSKATDTGVRWMPKHVDSSRLELQAHEVSERVKGGERSRS